MISLFTSFSVDLCCTGMDFIIECSIETGVGRKNSILGLVFGIIGIMFISLNQFLMELKKERWFLTLIVDSFCNKKAIVLILSSWQNH